MLILKDRTTGQLHEFSLTSETQKGTKMEFSLTSPTYPGLQKDFTLEHDIVIIYGGFSVTVHLFKNPFYVQSDIVEFRLDESALDRPGRIGYFFRLDALFEPGILEMDRHNYTYAYYAVQYLLSNGITLQTKEVEISSTLPRITDFFDDDTIVLVLCDQYTNKIPDFSIDNYLSHLFLYGFTPFRKENPIQKINSSLILSNNYYNSETLKRKKRKNLRVNSANPHISDEHFVIHLFKNLVQKENEVVTRFIMLYQIVEILIDKVIKIEVAAKVCGPLSGMSGHKIKEILSEQSSEKKRILMLFNSYARPSAELENHLKTLLFSFYLHINDVDFGDPAKHPDFNLTDIFYGYRNKLVHNYRIMHSPLIDPAITEGMMNDINETTEALIAHFVTHFNN